MAQKLPEPPENPEVLIEELIDEYDEEELECEWDDESEFAEESAL